MNKIIKIKSNSLKEDFDYSWDYAGGGHKGDLKGFFDPWLDIFKAGKLTLLDTINISYTSLNMLWQSIRGKSAKHSIDDYLARKHNIEKEWKPILENNKRVLKNMGFEIGILLFSASPEFFLASESLFALYETKKSVDEVMKSIGLNHDKSIHRMRDEQDDKEFKDKVDYFTNLHALFFGNPQNNHHNESKLYEDKQNKNYDFQQFEIELQNYLDRWGYSLELNLFFEKYCNDVIKEVENFIKFLEDFKGNLQKLEDNIKNYKNFEDFVNNIKVSFKEFNVNEYEKKYNEMVKSVIKQMTEKSEKEKSEVNAEEIRKEANLLVFEAQKKSFLESAKEEYKKLIEKEKDKFLSLFPDERNMNEIKLVSKVGKDFFKTYEKLNKL